MICALGCDKNNDVKNGLSFDEYIEAAHKYLSTSDNEKAILAYKKALKIKPTDANTHYELGWVYDTERKRSYAEAFNKYQFKILTNPHFKQTKDQESILEELGYKRQYNALAIQEYKETLKYDPSNWAARYYIATDYLNKKFYKEAIEQYKQVIKINPKYIDAYKLLGESYLEIGLCNSAFDTFKKAYEIDANTESYFCDIGKVYVVKKDYVKLNEMFNKLKASPYYREKLTEYQYQPHQRCTDQ